MSVERDWCFFLALFPISKEPLTHACIIEHSWKHQHDVVGPVLAVQRHLIFFNYQQMKVVDALHSMKKV